MSIRGTIGHTQNSSTELDLITNCLSSPIVESNSFINFKNPYLYVNDSIGIGQKQIIYKEPLYNQSNNNLYGSDIIFEMPQYDYPCYLAQIIIECTASCVGDNTNHQPRLATKMFSQVQLETLYGLRVDRDIRPNYTNMRLDTWPITHQQIEQSTDPTTTFNNSTVVYYLPCFFSFSEETSKFLYLSKSVEPIRLRATINDSFASMGLLADVTDLKFRVIMTVYRTITPVINRSVIITDVYYEPYYTVYPGNTSITIPISCNFPVILTSITMIDADQELLRPDSFIMYNSGKVINSMSQSFNYSLLNGETENNPIGSFNFWYLLNRTRNNVNYAVPLKNLENKTMTINFPSAVMTYKVYVLFEYITQRNMNDFEEGQYYERIWQY